MEDISLLNNQQGEILIRLGISLCIGFLIGMEREFSKPAKEKQFAGLRTHSLVSIFGFLSALIANEAGQWLLGVAFICLVAMVTVSYIQLSRYANQTGGTSEISTIITFLLAVLTFYDYVLIAVIITVIVLLLLAFKPPLHLFVKKLTRSELIAIIQFIIIAAIIIPFLPDRSFGPYDAWNLKNTWQMVVLVSGISLFGYLLSKMIGNKGILLSGVLGGLASSTMVSFVYSKRSNETPAGTSFFYALAILSASTIMFARVLFEVYVVNRQLIMHLVPAFLLIITTGIATAFAIHKMKKGSGESHFLPLKNPLNFTMAIKFALIYAAVLWLTKFLSEKFGESGTYAAGIISGIADMDAITISMAKSGLSSTIISRTILLAALSNTIVKLLIVMIMGNPVLRKWSAIGLGALLAAGIISFFLIL